MGFSLAVVAVTASLNLIAFVLAIGAERRRSTGRVVPDEYDERTFCVYDSDASSVYGLSAFAALLVSQAVMTGTTKCLCFGGRIARGRAGIPACAVSSFVVSWVGLSIGDIVIRGYLYFAYITATFALIASTMLSRLCFLAAEICLVAGSARNAYHTKYVGYYEKKDLTSCIALRKGIFAAAAAFVLILIISSLSFYWSYANTETAGWVKHQNEGVAMAEQGEDKGEFRSSRV